jgi:hypothetical protein
MSGPRRRRSNVRFSQRQLPPKLADDGHVLGPGSESPASRELRHSRSWPALAAVVLLSLGAVTAWLVAGAVSDSLDRRAEDHPPIPAGRRSTSPSQYPNEYARASFYEPQQSRLALAQSNTGTRVRTWEFRRGETAGWHVVGNASNRPHSRGTAISTTPGRFAYQLISPELELPTGRYILRIIGRVVDGGLGGGVIKTSTGAFFSRPFPSGDVGPARAGLYWDEQPFLVGGQMAVAFELSSPTEIQAILSNWAPEAYSSSWLLRTIVIDRLALGSGNQ